MKRFNAAATVEPGFYFNLREFQFVSLSEAGVLPGEIDSVWHRVPALLLLLVAPILGLSFVIFLPFIGLAMVGWLLAQKLAHASSEAAHATVRVMRPSWRPAMAFLFRSKRPAAPPAPTATKQDEWLDETKRRVSGDDKEHK